MSALHPLQKAAVVILALPTAVAAEVAGHFSPRELHRLTVAIAQLPDVSGANRSAVYREFQEELSQPFAGLAESRPHLFANLLRSRWLSGSSLRLELGEHLFRELVGRKGRHYDYLRSVRLGPAWHSLDGPHRKAELAPDAFRFVRDEAVLDEGRLAEEQFVVLDPAGDEKFAGCRFRRVPESDLTPSQRWQPTVLGPAEMLAWRTRVLAHPSSGRSERADDEEIRTFLSVARERSSRRGSLSEASGWLKAAKLTTWAGQIPLDEVIARSHPDFGAYRAAVLISAWWTGASARRKLYETLSEEERGALTRALFGLDRNLRELETFKELPLLNAWTDATQVELLRRVLRGGSLPIDAVRSRSLLLRVAPELGRGPLFGELLKLLPDDAALELQADYSARVVRQPPGKDLKRLLVEQLLLDTLTPLPEARVECPRLALRYPLESALALKKLLDGSWALARFERLVLEQPEEAARRLARFQPESFVTRKTRVATVLHLLTPPGAEGVLAYLRALGGEPDLDEPPDEDRGPTFATAFISVLREILP